MVNIFAVAAWGMSALTILGIVGTVERGGSLWLILLTIPALVVFWFAAKILEP